MTNKSEQPIGIFDSGVGGLTVANAIKHILPNEDIIYFGDIAHMPYGDKSKDTIIQYSKQITQFLIDKNCKIILIACNSASSNAYDEVVKLVGNKAIVVNVIDPVIDSITNETEYKHIGVIGTKSTIDSETYQKKIHDKKPGVLVSAMATPLFVPMIEEGFIFDDISNAIIRNYLSRHEIGNIEAIILGCTHYPIIKNQINKYYNFTVDVIDSAKIVSYFLRSILEKENLINSNGKGKKKFYVSDYTDYFRIISKMFFEEDIELEKITL